MGGIDSAWGLSLMFCPIRGLDPDEFGQLEHGELPRPLQLMEEDQIFLISAALQWRTRGRRVWRICWGRRRRRIFHG